VNPGPGLEYNLARCARRPTEPSDNPRDKELHGQSNSLSVALAEDQFEERGNLSEDVVFFFNPFHDVLEGARRVIFPLLAPSLHLEESAFPPRVAVPKRQTSISPVVRSTVSGTPKPIRFSPSRFIPFCPARLDNWPVFSQLAFV